MAPKMFPTSQVAKRAGQQQSRALRSGRGPPTTSLFGFLTQVAVLAVWKTLWTVSVPVGRFIALQLWLGKSFITLSIWLQHQLLKAIGWLAAPIPTSSRVSKVYKRTLGFDVRNWHVGLATLLAVGVISTAAKKWQERTDVRLKRRALLRRLMGAANSYEQWRDVAQQLYKLEESELPEEDYSTRKSAKLYDQNLLQDKINHLKRIRATGNAKEVMLALRTDLIRNIANIAKSQLHEHFVLIPEPIQQYLTQVKDQLQQLLDWPEDDLSSEEKLAFFRETRHTFGRTALLLSGGGGLGTFHIGVCKALFEQRLLPRVLAGSSVGSIVAAIIATRTDVELRDLFTRLDHFDISFFKNSRAVELVHHLINKGSLQDMSYMIKKLRSLLGDQTFLEAYERTGRILNVTVCPADTNEPPRLLNYLTAPQALIWSAVAASSAFPGLYPAQHLLARNSRGEIVKFSAQSSNDSLERRWRDGSLELDLPVQALGEMFNCNHFMVSQTNPHIVPLLNLKKCFSRKWANIMEAELKHRCQVLQWLLPEWVPSKWLMLFTQTWEGDVTMTLPSALWHLGKTIVNPTTEELIRAVKVGEVATWECISAIECNCSIEAMLDKCLAAVTNQVRGYRLHRMGNRIPSWLHMPAVGLPAVASWGDDLTNAASQLAALAMNQQQAQQQQQQAQAGAGAGAGASASGISGRSGASSMGGSSLNLNGLNGLNFGSLGLSGKQGGVDLPAMLAAAAAAAGSGASTAAIAAGLEHALSGSVGGAPGRGSSTGMTSDLQGGYHPGMVLGAGSAGGVSGGMSGASVLPSIRSPGGGSGVAAVSGGMGKRVISNSALDAFGSVDGIGGVVDGVPAGISALPTLPALKTGSVASRLGGSSTGLSNLGGGAARSSGHAAIAAAHGGGAGAGGMRRSGAVNLGMPAAAASDASGRSGVGLPLSSWPDGITIYEADSDGASSGSGSASHGSFSNMLGLGSLGNAGGASSMSHGGLAMGGDGGGGGSRGCSTRTSISVSLGSSSASSAASAAGDAASVSGSGSGKNSSSGTGGVSKELLDLACCDCTDASVSDLWSTLLPLATQCVGVGGNEEGGPAAAKVAAAAAGNSGRMPHSPSHDSALNVFAY